MDLSQQPLIKLDSVQEKPNDCADAASASQETPGQKKKLRTVGFYEIEVPQTSKSEEVTEDANLANENDGFPNEKEIMNGTQPQEGDTEGTQVGNPSYFDQTSPCSPKRCRKQSNPTCLCKECVQNYMNLCEEDLEPPSIEEKKDDVPVLCEDSVSIGSNRSRSESHSSERSRYINSSEDECLGQRYEDAQVTLPYPEKNQPPECITRLSNAGLYEPNEDMADKDCNKEEEKTSHLASIAFFVKHPDEQSNQQKRVQLEMMERVDIERGDPESEPFIHSVRRPTDFEPQHPMLCHCSRGCLKIVGSFVASLIVFPAFLFAAYSWLPFDAPVMPDIPTRLVYTMRCAAFATFPLVLGVIIHGISRLCASSYEPFKPREREVTIHRRFVKQGTFLFVLYFFNLCVLATYLHQDHLKLIPLLTCLFALAQLIYWLSFAVTRSFRGFGYGLTFLPLLFMMVANLYFMFVVEPEKMIFLGSKNAPSN